MTENLSQGVQARRAEYTRATSIRIKIGTWNTAACAGTEGDLGWLADDDIDIYVVALQEVVDLGSTTAYTQESDTTRWKNAMEGYECVAEQQMVGLLSLVFARVPVTARSTVVGTGLMGYLGNKGAVTTQLVLGETTRVAIVNCHLSSGADAASLERRCWDVGQILSRTRFDAEGIDDADVAFWVGDLNFRLTGLPGADIRRLLELHARGEYAEMPSPETFDIDDPSNDPESLQATLDSLLTHDELREVQRGRALQDWREGTITFPPTYKYDVGSVSRFDSSEKQRAPSWCDRILYRTRRDKEAYAEKLREQEEARRRDQELEARGVTEDDDVLFDYDPEDDEPLEAPVVEDQTLQLESYRAHGQVTTSDHKPLSAVFRLEYEAVDPELKAKIQAEVARELDRTENENRPVITIVADGDGTAVDFGTVGFRQRTTRQMTIANVGPVPATFFFVTDPSGQIAPRWLNIFLTESELSENLSEITLEPGDTSDLTLEVYVDNVKDRTLESILILRVNNGRDHFIHVRGTWRSCFGMSVDELIRIPEGGARNAEPGAVCWSAPRELFKLTAAIESLTERVLADMQMLDVSPPQDAGWPFDKASWTTERDLHDVVEALETDGNLLDPPPISAIQKLETMSEVLLLFLESLSDGIVPEQLWTQLEGKMGSDKTWVLDALSGAPNHNISLVFLTAMMSRVAGELTPVIHTKSRRTLSLREGPSRREEVNKRYAEIFAPLIFRTSNKKADERARAILELFLRD